MCWSESMCDVFKLRADDAFQKLMCAMGRGDVVIGCAVLAVPGRIHFSNHRSGLLYPLARGTPRQKETKTTAWAVNLELCGSTTDSEKDKTRARNVLLASD